jgi:hypothetical protein
MGLFDALRYGSRPRATSREEEPSPPQTQILAAQLESWATDKVCIDIFLPHLDSLIASADADEGESLTSHVGMAFARGKRDALKALRDEFTFWDKRN